MPTAANTSTDCNGPCTHLNNPTSPNTEHPSEDAVYETASHWSEMSASYSQSGEQAAALEARQKAVEVYRILHARRPELFESNLARELLGLSKDLAGNGRLQEAFSASQESGKLYRHILGQGTECARVQKPVQPPRYIREGSGGFLETRVVALAEQSHGYLALLDPLILLRYVRKMFQRSK